MRPFHRRSLSAPACIMAAMFALLIACPASAARLGWNNPAGGSAGTASNWTDTNNPAIHTVPGTADQARLEGTAGYTVTWPSSPDSIRQFLTGGTARPRLGALALLRIADDASVASDSFTVVRGILRANRWLVNSGRLLVSEAGTELVARDSTALSSFGASGAFTAVFQKGARFSSFGRVTIGGGASSCNVRFVGTSSPGATQAGFATHGSAGLVGRGQVVVGETSPASLQIERGAYGDVAGNLVLGQFTGVDGTVLLPAVLAGDSLPRLVVRGKTFLGCDSSLAAGGRGVLDVRSGQVRLLGAVQVRNGRVAITNGAALESGALSFEVASTVGGDSLEIAGAGSSALVHDGLSAGSQATGGTFPQHLSVHDGASLIYDGLSPLTLNPALLAQVHGGGRLESAAPIEVLGILTIGTMQPNGTLRAPLIHVQGSANIANTGILGLGSGAVVEGRLHVASTGTLQLFESVPSRWVLGDSTLTDGFTCAGLLTTDIPSSDTLRIFNSGTTTLSHVTMQGSNLVSVPRGTLVPSAGTMQLYGTQWSGDLICEGWLSGSSTYFRDRLTALDATVTLSYLQVGEFVARGNVGGTVAVSHSLSLGPAPATLFVASSLLLSPDCTLRMRAGSTSSGVRDFINVAQSPAPGGWLNLDGTLDVRTIPGNLPADGDSVTLLTVSPPTLTNPTPLTGSFSQVLLDGSPAAGRVEVRYTPNQVRIIFHNVTTGVEPGDTAAGPKTLAFSSSGDVARPGFRLALPEAANVRVTLFDVGGRSVATLCDAALKAGTHTIEVPGTSIANGFYFAQARISGASGTRVLRAKSIRLR